MPIQDFQTSEELKEGTPKMNYLLRDVKGIPALEHLNKAPEVQSKSKQDACPAPQFTANKNLSKRKAQPLSYSSGHGGSKLSSRSLSGKQPWVTAFT